jgi:hypothetical protein
MCVAKRQLKAGAVLGEYAGEVLPSTGANRERIARDAQVGRY